MDDYIKRKIQRAKNQETDILNLVKLRLYSIPEEVFECKNIKELHLEADCVVDEKSINLDEEFWWEVSFDNNEISSIPNEIYKLENLEVLNINQNYISKISPEIGKLQNLRELHLRNNSLTEIPKEIGSLKNLEILDLSFNNIKEIPIEIYKLKNLKELNLFSNNLTFIPSGIEKLKKLEILNIANYNPSKVFTETIERFELTTNHFEVLPEAIAEIENLKLLYYDFAVSKELEDILDYGFSIYPWVIDSNEKIMALMKKYYPETNSEN